MFDSMLSLGITYVVRTVHLNSFGRTGLQKWWPRESVLGRDIDACLGRFLDGMPRKCPVAEGDVGMQGCLVEISKENPLFPESFERVEIR